MFGKFNSFVLAALLAKSANAVDNGLAITPQMGWVSFLPARSPLLVTDNGAEFLERVCPQR
jgi:hypothetical protein